MRRYAKIISLLLCTAILISGLSISVLAAEEQISGADLLAEMYANQQMIDAANNPVQDQSELFSLYQQIEQQMRAHATTATMAISTEDDTQYNETYGGAYIEDGKLIVCVTSSITTPETASDLLVYRIVENSYNSLAQLKDSLSSKYVDLYSEYSSTSGAEFNMLASISGMGVDEELNAVIIDMVDLTDDKIELFEKVFDVDSCIVFQEAGEQGEDATAYKPGRAIYVITNRSGSTITYSRLSIGYRALRITSSTTEYGFATCGHGIKESVDGNVYTSTSFTTVIGTISDWMYSDSVDASFVRLSSSDSITTQTHYSDDSGSTSGGDTLSSGVYMSSIAKGSTVYKVGSTTYKTSATVKNTNYDFTVNGVTFTNLTKTGSFCDSGDSGGLVYMYYEDQYIPAGLVKGMGGWWIFSYSVFVKAVEVADAMGVYPY